MSPPRAISASGISFASPEAGLHDVRLPRNRTAIRWRQARPAEWGWGGRGPAARKPQQHADQKKQVGGEPCPVNPAEVIPQGDLSGLHQRVHRREPGDHFLKADGQLIDGPGHQPHRAPEHHAASGCFQCPHRGSPPLAFFFQYTCPAAPVNARRAYFEPLGSADSAPASERAARRRPEIVRRGRGQFLAAFFMTRRVMSRSMYSPFSSLEIASGFSSASARPFMR